MKENRRVKYIRIASFSFLAFSVMFSYAIARPSAESLFLATHSSKSLPLVWLIVAAAMLCVVAIYNWFVTKHDLIRLFGYAAFASSITLVGLLLLKRMEVYGVNYAIYVWKDIYVVVLVDLFYMYANSVFPIKTARWIYGFFGAFAAAGSIVGNLLVGKLAMAYGTVGSFWFAVPVLALIGFFCLPLSKIVGIGKPLEKKYNHAHIREAWKVVRNSSYLTLILLLIFVVQIAVVLIDFEFNGVVESAFPDMDVRTGMIGKIYAIINSATFVLHLITGPLLRLVTVPGALISIPFILALSVVTFIAFPAFMVVAVMKAASKVFDYTIFKSAKEILYIPLTYEEKTMGKSIVDMLSYRIAKGGASLLLMGILGLGLMKIVPWVTLALILLWIVITWAIVKRFRSKVDRSQEMTSDFVNR
ncbi:MAG: hypothetical protein HN337_07865 [Deltaproteobacteria bacterium]|jgi:ATP:ADP antiporter, AAA family|nr:hypothetical protein [Deltaproteobacteria bacterium]